jgi:hypothetical protein
MRILNLPPPKLSNCGVFESRFQLIWTKISWDFVVCEHPPLSKLQPFHAKHWLIWSIFVDVSSRTQQSVRHRPEIRCLNVEICKIVYTMLGRFPCVVVRIIVALPLDQILRLTVTKAPVQDLFDHKLLFFVGHCSSN